METEEDFPVEYRELIRDAHPKISQMHKIHRWRYTTEDDNIIAKIVYVEGLKKDEILDNKVCEKILAEVNNDWTGMRHGVLYSFKKRKGWELANNIELNMPEYDNFKLPVEIVSSSLARFDQIRTHPGFPRYWFCYCNLEKFGTAVKNLTWTDQNGDWKSRNGKMNKGYTKEILKSLNETEENEDKSPKIHVQFQTVEYRKIPKKHNSNIYDYHTSSDYLWTHRRHREDYSDIIAEVRACCRVCDPFFGLDVDPICTADLGECDCLYCCEGQEKSIRETFVFGDFFDVHDIAQENRKHKLKDWVLV